MCIHEPRDILRQAAGQSIWPLTQPAVRHGTVPSLLQAKQIFSSFPGPAGFAAAVSVLTVSSSGGATDCLEVTTGLSQPFESNTPIRDRVHRPKRNMFLRTS